MDALLPGIRYAAERAVENLNEARAMVGLPPARLDVPGVLTARKRGRPPKVRAAEPEPAAPAESAVVTTTRPKRRKVSATARDWALVKEAGIVATHRPSRQMVERAMKKLARVNGQAS